MVPIFVSLTNLGIALAFEYTLQLQQWKF